MEHSRTAGKQQGGRCPNTTGRVGLHDEGLEQLDCPDLSRRHDANWERNESHERSRTDVTRTGKKPCLARIYVGTRGTTVHGGHLDMKTLNTRRLDSSTRLMPIEEVY